MNVDILGFLDPNITVGIIREGILVEKRKPQMPKALKNVIRCRNPRCITSTEEEIDQIFLLSENNKYRCAYCEQEYQPKRK